MLTRRKIALAAGWALSAALLIPNARAGESSRVVYAFPGLHGRVIAEETKQPLSGVSVLAVWVARELKDFPVPTLRVFETESRADGSFDVPAWESTLSASVDADSSRLMLLAPGRRPDLSTDLLNAAPGPIEVRLPAFQGRPEHLVPDLRNLAWLLGLTWAPLSGHPRPKMVSALEREWQRLPEEARGTGPNMREWFEFTVESTRRTVEAERLKRKR